MYAFVQNPNYTALSEEYGKFGNVYVAKESGTTRRGVVNCLDFVDLPASTEGPHGGAAYA